MPAKLTYATGIKSEIFVLNFSDLTTLIDEMPHNLFKWKSNWNNTSENFINN